MKNLLSESYCIILGMNHYTCMVDLLGHVDYLDKALNFIAKLPIKLELGVWMCLLVVCRSYKNVAIGEFMTTNFFFFGA